VPYYSVPRDGVVVSARFSRQKHDHYIENQVERDRGQKQALFVENSGWFLNHLIYIRHRTLGYNSFQFSRPGVAQTPQVIALHFLYDHVWIATEASQPSNFTKLEIIYLESK
jgi:hypothetical protein